MNSTPQGVVALFIGPDGRVIAQEADFDRSTPNGTQPSVGQTHRARNRLYRAACRAMMNEDMADTLSAYSAERILDGMRKKGYRIEVISIGDAS